MTDHKSMEKTYIGGVHHSFGRMLDWIKARIFCILYSQPNAIMNKTEQINRLYWESPFFLPKKRVLFVWPKTSKKVA